MVKLIDVQPAKKCSKCAVEKPLHEYGRRTASADGKTSQCKACVRAKARIGIAMRRAANKGKTTKPDAPFGDARLLTRPMGQWAEE